MKIKLPLVERYVARIPCPCPVVTVWVRTRYHDYDKVRFMIDTGADFTALPIPLARKVGIDFPRTEAARGRAAGLVGRVEKYLGSLHVRIAGEEFDWPCGFLDSPILSPAPAASSVLLREGEYGVLGRAGFLTAFALSIDGDYLTLTRRFSDRPWWYRLGRRLWPGIPLWRRANDPL